MKRMRTRALSANDYRLRRNGRRRRERGGSKTSAECGNGHPPGFSPIRDFRLIRTMDIRCPTLTNNTAFSGVGHGRPAVMCAVRRSAIGITRGGERFLVGCGARRMREAWALHREQKDVRQYT